MPSSAPGIRNGTIRRPARRPLPPVESPARGGTGWILAAAVVLFLAAAGVFIGLALFGTRLRRVTAKTAGDSPPPPAAPAAAPVHQSTAPATPAASPPPRPPRAANTTQDSGIIFSATRPLAIVDGKTVNVGDRVGDFQVKQILKDSVIFLQPDGSRKTLDIGE